MGVELTALEFTSAVISLIAAPEAIAEETVDVAPVVASLVAVVLMEVGEEVIESQPEVTVALLAAEARVDAFELPI